jgi:Ca-activated chloride channel family protein
VLVFEAKWAFALLPLPLLVWWLAPPYRERADALAIPFFEKLAKVAGATPRRRAVSPTRKWILWIVTPLIWALLVTALARPEWVAAPIEKVVPARDLLLAVDLSYSMDTTDYRDPDGKLVDRLTAVKLVLDEFISRREGDRLGLVVFADEAYVQIPFTLDHAAVRKVLEQTELGMAGQRTMIGDAIGLGIRLFAQSRVPQKVIVLLTDGNDTGSRVPPERAAEIATERGIRIYTVGIGSVSSGDYDVDTAMLTSIAGDTGGRFYMAQRREELDALLREIDALETVELEVESYRPRRSLYYVPLGMAIVLALIGQLSVFLFTLVSGRPLHVRHAGLEKSGHPEEVR